MLIIPFLVFISIFPTIQFNSNVEYIFNPDATVTIAFVEKPIELQLDRPAILQKIAYCESGDRHFNADGTVIRGKVNRYDVGRYQINEKYHGQAARAMGLDLEREVDNEVYAKHLLSSQGTWPWNPSRTCWG